MSILPDEIWSRILEIGVESTKVGYRELCCVGISCRRFHRLSLDPTLWATLLSLDFPTSTSSDSRNGCSQPPPSKSLYKAKYEKDKERRALEHLRAVLQAEARVVVSKRRLMEIKMSVADEGKRMKATAEELDNLERARTASVALNIWQPQVVRGCQRQLVEQSTVPVESHLNALRMELKVCKQQMTVLKNRYNKEKQKLTEYEHALQQVKYHPLHNDYLSPAVVSEPSVKRKRLKCIDCPESSK